MSCKPCKGAGWIPHEGDWRKCEACKGSGEPGQHHPEFMDSYGRIHHNVMSHRRPKPKPTLRIVKP